MSLEKTPSFCTEFQSAFFPQEPQSFQVGVGATTWKVSNRGFRKCDFQYRGFEGQLQNIYWTKAMT